MTHTFSRHARNQTARDRAGSALRRAGLLIASLLIASLLLPAPAGAGQEVTLDGVVHVKNGATPSQGRQTLQLEKLWSAGGEDEETLFGLITQVQTDPQGNMYLLDTQLSEVRVFSPAGEELRTIGREGEGPGEVRTPVDLVMLPDRTLGLVQAFPGKVVKIDLEGNPAGTINVGGSDPAQGNLVVLLDVRPRGDELVVAGMLIGVKPDGSGQSRTRILSSYSLDGQEKVRYCSHVTELNFQDLKFKESEEYFVFPRRWALDAQGRVYAATARDRYEIQVYNADGTVARVIEREFARPKRSAIEQSRIQSVADAQKRQIPVEIAIELEEYEPVIARIQIMDNGEIWVAHSGSHRDQPAGVLITYDVFDPAGHFARQVAVACEGDGDNDGLFFFGADRALLVKGLSDAAMALQGGGGAVPEGEEEPAPMEVICFAVKR